jgi:ATP-dependent protease HslVU (ClpYQ) peptidase subunit
MTCIAILKNRSGKLLFASDRRVTAGNYAYPLPVPKTIQRDGIILAGAGCAFLDSTLVFTLPIPKKPDNLSIHEYMFCTFLPCTLHHLRKQKIIHPLENRLNVDPLFTSGQIDPEDSYAATFVIGIAGQLFVMDFDSKSVALDIVGTPYAIGCGSQYALGSLKTTEHMKLTTKARLQIALRVTAELDPNCDSKIDFTQEA